MENKSKLVQHYINLLFLYVLLLFVFFFLYAFTICVSDYNLEKEQYEVEIKKMEGGVIDILDNFMKSALSITSRVNYSLSFRDPYIKLISGGELSAKDRTTMIQELRNAYAWSGMTDIEEVVLFVDNSDIALSASGIVQLQEPFQHQSFPTAYIETTSISSLLGVESSRFTFSDENIIFVYGFRYQGGNDRGVICISYNKDKVLKSIENILGKNEYTLLFASNTILSNAEINQSENAVTLSSKENLKLRLMVSFSEYKWNGPSLSALIYLFCGFVLLLVIFTIFMISRYRYKESIKKIRNLIPGKEGIGDDEIESIVNDLKGVLIENDSYKETLEEIGGYVEKGFFTSDYNGGEDAVMRYLGFVRPYYLVIAINIDDYSVDLDKILTIVGEAISDDSLCVLHYLRDKESAFMFINSDTIPDEENFSEVIYKSIKGHLEEGKMVTIGVDIPRQDFVEFKKSCSEALSALKLMLVRGKDDIYFSGEREDEKCEYYMIPSLDVQIAKAIRDEDRERINILFSSLLKTNLMKYDLTSNSVFALSDELYYIELKVLRSISVGEERKKAVKPGKYSTIEEVIQFYSSLYLSMIDDIKKNVEEEDDNYKNLLEYVDTHYTDQDISLKNLGDLFSLSTKSIGNYFSLKFHMTYLDYVTKKRIELAMALIKDEKYSIDEVAKSCGYSSTLTFRRNFKDMTGVTPSEYRSRDNSF